MKRFLSLSALLITFFLTSNQLFADTITINNSYVREVPPGVPSSASFLTLTNSGDTDIALTKVTGDIAKNIELHEHVHKDGMMEMRQVAKISIKAKGTTELKPGGFHIMLIGLNRSLKSGDEVVLTLEFDDGTQQTIKPTVKKVMQGMMMKDGKKKMKHHGSMMHENMEKGKKGKMKLMKHVNPMPNLMKVYKQMGHKLNLSDEQVIKLDAGIKERSPVIKRLIASVVKLEAALLQASLNNDPVEKIEQLANQLMTDRLAIIKGKTYCRESVKKVMSEQQFKKLVALYKDNYI